MAFLPHTLGSNSELPPFNPDLIAAFTSYYDRFIGRLAIIQESRLASLVRLDARQVVDHDVYYHFTELAVCGIKLGTPSEILFSDEIVNREGVFVSLHNSASQFFDSYWLIASSYITTHILFNDQLTGLFAARNGSWFDLYFPMRKDIGRSLSQYQVEHGKEWFEKSIGALLEGQHFA